MHQKAKGFDVRIGGVLQHGEIAIAIAKCRDRALAHEKVDRHGFIGCIVIEGPDIVLVIFVPSSDNANSPSENDPITCSGGIPYIFATVRA